MNPYRIVSYRISGIAHGITLISDSKNIDNDLVVYSVLESTKPNGLNINPFTGVVNWTPTFSQAGSYVITVIAKETLLTTGFTVFKDITVTIDNVNRLPNLASLSHHKTVIGGQLQFTIQAQDADIDDSLTYSVLDPHPSDLSLNSVTGEVTWTPNVNHLGDHIVTFAVHDGTATVNKAIILRVTSLPEPPIVFLVVTPSFPSLVNKPVAVQVTAASLVSLSSIELKLNNQLVAVNERGIAIIKLTQAGQRYELTAVVTDVDGVTGTNSVVVRARTGQDTSEPTVEFHPSVYDALITGIFSFRGTVTD